MSSTVHAFFSQRKKDLASGTATSDTATAEKLFGSATPATPPMKRAFHVAVQGCCHGDLGLIYDACAAHERETHKKIDLLICCGDFQSTRSTWDLASMAVPDKYKTVGDFPRYYKPIEDDYGEHDKGDAHRALPTAIAPYLTLFVGGNHENSDWLAEESYGGFLAPNIYYLGHSGVVEVDGKLRVAGLSGIFKAVDYGRPYPEQRPYRDSESAKRSAYHVRKIEQEKLLCYCRARELIRAGRRSRGTTTAAAPSGGVPAAGRESPVLVDVMASHDWPAGITKYGDEAQLLRYKPYFSDEVAHNALGNPHTMTLLRAAKPQHWVAAHLHCLFTAAVQHSMESGGGRVCETHFLALDKCAKKKGFLDFLDIPICATTAAGEEGGEEPPPPPPSTREAPSSSSSNRSLYADRVRRDPVWLAVLRHSHAFLAGNRTRDSGGFDAETAAQAIAKDFVSDSREPTAPERSVTATCSLTTGAVLRALGLPRAVPLQVVMGTTTPSMAARSRRTDSSNKDGGGSGSAACQPPPLPPSPQPATIVRDATTLEPLGWSEDVGG